MENAIITTDELLPLCKSSYNADSVLSVHNVLHLHKTSLCSIFLLKLQVFTSICYSNQEMGPIILLTLIHSMAAVAQDYQNDYYTSSFLNFDDLIVVDKKEETPSPRPTFDTFLRSMVDRSYKSTWTFENSNLLNHTNF